MRIKILSTCLIFFTIVGFLNNAYAHNWLLIYKQNGAEFYWDQDIRLQTNHRGNYLVWNMNTLVPGGWVEKNHIKDSNPNRTIIDKKEIDCNLNRYRSVYMEFYDKYMGKGNLLMKMDFEELETEKRNAWKYLKKNDIRNMAYIVFCEKFKPNKK